jgi:hypothetical protein
MVTIIFVVSQFTQPSGILDTSSAVLADETFLFNNIKEKSISIVKLSDSCRDLGFDLEEYKLFIEGFATQRNIRVVYDFEIVQPCSDATMTTDFYIALKSPRASTDSTFTASKQS